MSATTDREPGATPTPLILGCVSEKREHPAPARDLYVSALFDERRRYADAAGRPWLIFSALHGIVDPDTVLAPYDVSLQGASRAERRRIGELAAGQLEDRLGPLVGRTFEVHAGAAYVEGLAPALERRGARLLNPLQGLRIGEQLHWYLVHTPTDGAQPSDRPIRAPHPAASTASAVQVADAGPGTVALTAATPLAPFTYRWPAGVEAFDRGWDLTVRQDGEAVHVRHGLGHRVVYGRHRVHSVTWVAGQPMVEGVAADDYADTAALVSVLRVGARAMVRVPADIPPGYEGFRIVDHAAEVVAPYTRHALAVKIAVDDLAGWARHALLRARAKRLPAPGARPPIATPPQPAPPQPAPRPDTQAVVAALLAYAATNPLPQDEAEPLFTLNPAANHLVASDPFAFLLAVIFDQGIVAERAWAAPYELRERLGHLDPARIVAEPERVEAAVQTPPKLQRYVTKVPAWVRSAAQRVLREYGGDAGRIWADAPSAATLQRRLDAFEGIGQKKAAMAVEILARDLKVAITDLAGSDIAYDVHVRRVFLRTGLAERDDLDHMVQVARTLHPERPGALDFPAWLIGRQWCRAAVPLCPECAIAGACPKLVGRAAGVQGA